MTAYWFFCGSWAFSTMACMFLDGAGLITPRESRAVFGWQAGGGVLVYVLGRLLAE